MIWERDPLWAKAKLFFERAFEHSDDNALYGLWCSLGIELLARATLASISPTLLAEPDREHKNLLQVFGVGPKNPTPKSITASQVLLLCQNLFDGFTREDFTACMALVNRRNSELHSAEAAFESYPSRQWLPGFYRACSSLVLALGETLDSLLGTEHARFAAEVLAQSKESVAGRVSASIAAHKRVFEAKEAEERDRLSADAAMEVAGLVHERHHKVRCPACGSDAAIEGDPFGGERVEHQEDGVTVRQSVSPRSFRCPACDLKLSGYAELDAADLGGTYTRTTTYTPEDYYGLVDPDSPEMQQYVEKYLEDMAHEYDNE